MSKQPIQTNKAPEAIGAYSQAIKSGDLLFISGQIPLNPETMEVEDSSFEESASVSYTHLTLPTTHDV